MVHFRFVLRVKAQGLQPLGFEDVIDTSKPAGGLDVVKVPQLVIESQCNPATEQRARTATPRPSVR